MGSHFPHYRLDVVIHFALYWIVATQNSQQTLHIVFVRDERYCLLAYSQEYDRRKDPAAAEEKEQPRRLCSNR